MSTLACGTPVFPLAMGGIEDYLEDGFDGVAVRYNAEQIAGKLQYALQRPAFDGYPAAVARAADE